MKMYFHSAICFAVRIFLALYFYKHAFIANLCVKMLHKLEEVCTFLAKDLVVSNLFRNFAVGLTNTHNYG